MEWHKGRGTKYKHLYQGGKAICGSNASPYPLDFFANTFFAPKCPKCLRISADAFKATSQKETDG